MNISIPNNFTPRSYQKKIMKYFDRGGKRAVWVVHRRGGKDLTMMHQTCKMMHERKGVYWHIFPSSEQARKAIWEGFTKDGSRIMEQVFPSVIRKKPREFLPSSEMIVELKCGSIWRLMGSDRMEVVGAGPVGVVFSEFALAKPTTWNLVRPMLRENDGWAAFITTPRGNNHAKKIYDVAGVEDGWFRDLQTLYDTRAYDPDRTIAEERAEGMPESLIQQEYMCDWTASDVGTVFGELVSNLEKRGSILDFEHDTNQVFTSWDLGVADSTGIWFWRVNDQGAPDLIDHYENHGKPMEHYFDVIDGRETASTKDVSRELLKRCAEYRYIKHWMPHDARQRHLTGSVMQRCIDYWGAAKVALTPSLSLIDGIQSARWCLQQPGMRIHSRCTQGVEALKHYRYAYDEDRKTFSNNPLHDWSSHSADSFRYMSVVFKHSDQIMRREKPAMKPVARQLNYGFSLDELYSLEESKSGDRRL